VEQQCAESRRYQSERREAGRWPFNRPFMSCNLE
jgi:hypothetical protein